MSLNPNDWIGMIAVLWVSLILHELAHGWMAYWLGDSTARDRGELSPNPLQHLDPGGGVLLPVATAILLQFPLGYSRSVTVDRNMLRKPTAGMIGICLAGPAASFLIAAMFGVLFRASVFIHGYGWIDLLNIGLLLDCFQYGVVFNLIWGLVNLIPWPPTDGFLALIAWFPRPCRRRLKTFVAPGVVALILLLVFLVVYHRPLIYAFFDFLEFIQNILLGGKVKLPHPRAPWYLFR